MRCATCPAAGGRCPGEDVPRLCQLARDREDYRLRLATLAAPAPVRPDRATLARVAGCPERGPVLPIGQQPECGCAELTACRAGRGAHPGRVTLRDCLACVGAGAAQDGSTRA